MTLRRQRGPLAVEVGRTLAQNALWFGLFACARGLTGLLTPSGPSTVDAGPLLAPFGLTASAVALLAGPVVAGLGALALIRLAQRGKP
jgi:hypothetical protein